MRRACLTSRRVSSGNRTREGAFNALDGGSFISYEFTRLMISRKDGSPIVYEGPVRVSLQIPSKLYRELVDWQHKNRFASLSEAIRQLLQRALDAEAPTKGKRK